MKFTILLPISFSEMSVETLLTTQWLVPKKQRHFLRTKHHILVNGTVARFEDLVHSADQVTVIFDDSDFPNKKLVFGDKNLADVLYEDTHLIIVNKPENMKTHGNSDGEIALQNHVSAFCGTPVFVVHRLDFETSGAVLFAKNQFVLPILDAMLRERQIHRTYHAFCAGYFSEKSFTIDQNIGTDRHDKKRRLVVSRGGQHAVTHVRVLADFSAESLVACQLDTGRTHQIRVHLSSCGHAILGDPIYRGSSCSRLMLHAKHLQLRHPFTKEKIYVSADSESFAQVMSAQKRRQKQG
ncbi:pseudouridine synthase [Lactococcus hodotermopsidis]|uniref:RNA pseudouridylate synthase n=1 Tax=Pseudolactococcus hodotermopsidis TaxID=2709157 RepID=A0A6A0BCV3_9LACT|nr:RluA family pseudouridine synthase [Lactococcus hodotermopsidis]GFH42465.1 pseudouridine synthase [Lactococcus hodotermopsidis]